ncbi:hypothetical protein ACTXT7_005992 [Hymenolepis weldensis]
MAYKTSSKTNLILCLFFLIGFLYFIINRYSPIPASKLLASLKLSLTKPLLPCKDPNARENFERARQLLFKQNLSLAEIDQIATVEISSYNCSYKDPTEPKILIVVPYRSRELDLLSFIIHMVPYFRHLGRKMEILIAEQSGTRPFNRGKIFNAAVREIKKTSDRDRLSGSTCFAFHDVDKLPVNLDVPYSCTTGPQQLLQIYHNDNGTLDIYPTFLGGVTMFSMDQMDRINGASNSFEGWGGEDDDLWKRVQVVGMEVLRPDKNKGQFYEGNFHHSRDKNPNRLKLLNRLNQKSLMLSDGLRQVNYTLESRYFRFISCLLIINNSRHYFSANACA